MSAVSSMWRQRLGRQRPFRPSRVPCTSTMLYTIWNAPRARCIYLELLSCSFEIAWKGQ